jgi:acyl-CoA thioesterase-2
MSKTLDELVLLLALERIEENLFRGQSQDLGWGTVFGGQVLGQALSAAVQTVPAERHVHSLQAYFLRPGDVTKPIVYDVDRIRDGGSFTTRRVVAIQAGKAIFNMAASFQKIEPGFEHQDEMPEAPEPESLPTEQERIRAFAHKLPQFFRDRILVERPLEVRTIDGEPAAPADSATDVASQKETESDPFEPSRRPPRRMVWLRTVGQLPDDPALHRYLLAYASDYSLLSTALLPHGVSLFAPGMQAASIDHVMWFHQPFRVDEWLLHVMDSPAAHGARGLSRGRVFTRDGRLVASTAQEGLIRRHTK